MPVFDGKKYKMEKSEGFDEYMKALGEFKVFNLNIRKTTLNKYGKRVALFSVCSFPSVFEEKEN